MAWSRSRVVLAIVAVTVVALATSASAALLTVGSTAPAEDGLDIANLAPRTGSEKLWTDTRAIGQTFKTGSEDAVLDAITLQSAAGSLATKNYTLTIGTVSGTSYSAFATESAIVQSVDSVPDDYWTFTLDTPVTLSANTDYGFDLAMNSSTTGWQSGIPYRATTADVYSDGSQFRSQQNGQSTPTIGYIGGDKVFHLNLEPVGGGGPVPVPIPVPNGEFAVYKPGTGYTVRGTVPSDIWVQQIGDNRPLSSGTPVDFDDGTSGMVVDIPGWITPRDSQGSPTGTADLFTLGFDPTDGTSCLNAFGAWSGQNGNLAESAAPLDVPDNRAGMTLELKAMVIGNVGARTFDLLVDGVALTPDSLVDPTYDAGIWQEILRTYTDIPDGDLTILVGTSRPGPGDPALFGTRMRVDNIQLSMLGADVIPEPATLSLLGLGALALLRRRKTR